MTVQIDINGSFEQGWTTLPPYPGTNLRNQVPKKWSLTVVEPGAFLPASKDRATGYPECVHKLCKQLPPEECAGGSNALILDGDAVYKIFSAQEAYGVTLSQTVKGLRNYVGTHYSFSVPVNIHNQHNNQDPYGAEVYVGVNGTGGWYQIEDFVDREYSTVVVDGLLDRSFAFLEIIVKSKWEQGIDFFIDNVQFTLSGVHPPDGCVDERVQKLESIIFDLDSRLTAMENENVLSDSALEETKEEAGRCKELVGELGRVVDGIAIRVTGARIDISNIKGRIADLDDQNPEKTA